MTRAGLRRVATWAGRALALAAITFVAISFAGQWRAIANRDMTAAIWAEVAAAGVAYGFLYLLIAEAWHRLIGDFAGRALPRYLTVASYAVSQLAKYVPGNVFSYLGRHAYMARGGVANAPLLKALSWEIAFHLAGSLLVVAVTILLLPAALGMLPTGPLQAGAIAALVGAVIFGILLLTSRKFSARLGTLRPRAGTAAMVLALNTAFFTAQAFVFTLLGLAIEGTMVWPLLTVGVLSWLAGFVPLGTPAGLGTREAMVLLLAGPLIGAADALLLAVLFRFTTTIGDLTCAGYGSLIARTGPRLAAQRPEA